MATAATIQNSNVHGANPGYFQTACDKVAPAARAAQSAAKTVFAICTNPLVVYVVASNAVLAHSLDISFNRMLTLNLASTFAGLAAGAVAGYGRAKIMGKQEIAITIDRTPGAAETPVIQVTSKNFKKEVLESTTPVIVDAYATWCPPCKAVAPIFAELSNDMKGKVKFVKVNVDEESSLAKDLHIQAMPTFLIYKDGKVVDRHEGAMSKIAMFSKLLNVLV